MFTGLVEATGALRRMTRQSAAARLEIEAPFTELTLGESISVSGACLTVVAASAGAFSADASRETLERTTLGDLQPGSRVNLERAVTTGTRLGGHLVTGHVDGVATVAKVEAVGEALRVELEAPATLFPFIAEKGSVTLDGVSLTVNRAGTSSFEIMLIPHTLRVTTLEDIAVGRRLNLEVDLVARYVVRYLEVTSGQGPRPDLANALQRAGYMDPK